MDHSDSIDVTAAPSAAFALVTDLPAMGRFSPENTGGEWLHGARRASLGAIFRGTNAQGKRKWTTRAKVVRYEEPEHFSFSVNFMGIKVSTWHYEITATDSGCRITESWVDDRSAVSKKLFKTVEDRGDYTKESIRHTLEAMKAELERT